MATYNELFDLLNNSELRNKISVAVGVSAETIRTELATVPNHTNRLIWSQDAFKNPQRIAREVMWSVIIANRTATVAQILAATDAAIQTNVDDVVDHFATGVV